MILSSLVYLLYLSPLGLSIFSYSVNTVVLGVCDRDFIL